MAIERIASLLGLQLNPSSKFNGTLDFSQVQSYFLATKKKKKKPLYYHDMWLHKRALRSSFCFQPGNMAAWKASLRKAEASRSKKS